MLRKDECRNHELADERGICSPTPQSVKVINQSKGAVTFMRGCGRTWLPYSFPSGTLDFIPTMLKSGKKDSATYYLSHHNSSSTQGDNLPYTVTLYDPYNMQVAPNPGNRNSPLPGYQVEVFQNNKKLGEVTPFSRPLFASTTPGGVIVLKLVNSSINIGPNNIGLPEEAYPQPQPPQPQPPQPPQPQPPQPPQPQPPQPPQPQPPQPPQPQPPQPPQPQPPPEQTPGQITNEPFSLLREDIAATNTSILNSVNSLDNTLSSFGQSIQTMQNNFLALGSNLDRSVNGLTTILGNVDDETKKGNKTWIWIGVGVAAIFILLLIGFLVYFIMKGKKKATVVTAPATTYRATGAPLTSLNEETTYEQTRVNEKDITPAE